MFAILPRLKTALMQRTPEALSLICVAIALVFLMIAWKGSHGLKTVAILYAGLP